MARIRHGAQRAVIYDVEVSMEIRGKVFSKLLKRHSIGRNVGLPRQQFFEAHSALLRSGRSFSGNERNCCFLNLNGNRFADISAIAGIDFPDDSRAVCVVDWDFDGDLDFWMLNRTSPRIRFLEAMWTTKMLFSLFGSLVHPAIATLLAQGLNCTWRTTVVL